MKATPHRQARRSEIEASVAEVHDPGSRLIKMARNVGEYPDLIWDQ